MRRFNIPGHRFRRNLALFAIVSTCCIGGFAHSATLNRDLPSVTGIPQDGASALNSSNTTWKDGASSTIESNFAVNDAAIGTNGIVDPSGYLPSVPGATLSHTSEIFTTTPKATTAWLIVAGVWFLTFTWKRRRSHSRR